MRLQAGCLPRNECAFRLPFELQAVQLFKLRFDFPLKDVHPAPPGGNWTGPTPPGPPRIGVTEI